MKLFLAAALLTSPLLASCAHPLERVVEERRQQRIGASYAGRPITDLASELRYPELVADAQEVLRKLAAVEKSISATDGRWYTVRIMPYRTLDDRIDGVVITFTNTTVSKALEVKLRDKHAVLEKHVATQATQLKHGNKAAKP